MPAPNNQPYDPRSPNNYPGQNPQAQYGQQPHGTPPPLYQPPTPPQQEGSPYDFFLDPGAKSKKSSARRGGPKIIKPLLIALGIVFILGMAAVVISSSRRGGDESTVVLASILSSQQEIIRVNTLASSKVHSASLTNFSETAVSVTTTAQQELYDYCSKNGVSVDSKQIAATKNTKTDQTLDAAQSASTYDETFKTTMQKMLTDYQVKLQQTRDTTASQGRRTILDKNLTSAQRLQTMLNQ